MKNHIIQPISIAPLATFRIVFGLVLFISIIRFISKGWIEQLYLSPTYLFSYYGFSWISPMGAIGMNTLFIGLAITALCIMLGWKYKLSIILFFIGFTYVELLDKSNYLNHYYFVSVICFLLIWVPANRYASLDVLYKPSLIRTKVPAWCINIFKLQLCIVYFYAGFAKLHSDWMLKALPLKIWLPAHADLPILGPLLTKEWIAYAFSWSGALYDLLIPFLLLIPATRLGAFVLVVAFHLLTRLLFPIGMFPYIMIASTLIFFSAFWHERNFNWLSNLFYKKSKSNNPTPSVWKTTSNKALSGLMVLFFIIQLLVPFRHHLYNGNLFWTEEGYRFSWRVMLVEKAGHATFYVKDASTNNEAQVDLKKYLLPHQEKQMAFQPDMIVQFAHFLAKEYRTLGVQSPQVRVEAYVTLNGRKSKLLIDPTIDLSLKPYNLLPRKWILPYKVKET